MCNTYDSYLGIDSGINTDTPPTWYLKCWSWLDLPPDYLYLTPHFLCELVSFIISKRLLGGDYVIGLDQILIEHNDIIYHEKIGSLSGIFGCIEVEIILIIINNLKLRQICVQPYKYISKITGGISRLHKHIEAVIHATRGINYFSLFRV